MKWPKKSQVTNHFHDCKQKLRLTNKITTLDSFVELHNSNFEKLFQPEGILRIICSNTEHLLNTLTTNNINQVSQVSHRTSGAPQHIDTGAAQKDLHPLEVVLE